MIKYIDQLELLFYFRWSFSQGLAAGIEAAAFCGPAPIAIGGSGEQKLQRIPIAIGTGLAAQKINMMNIKEINQLCSNTLVSRLGIEFLECTKNKVVATMPVNQNTHQPLGYLHGGASLALAETVGSAGSLFSIDTEKYLAFGMNVSGNHVSSIREGMVIATATIVHRGQTSHVWDVEIRDEEGKLISVARVTNAIVEKK